MKPPTLIGRLQEFWRVISPASGVVEPAVNVLDEWRTEFLWRGPALVVDRRKQQLQRAGNVLARRTDIRTVDVTHVRDDDRPDYWEVSVSTGMFSGTEVGRTRDDVEASIAAARLATVLEVPVRSLSKRVR